MSLSATPAPSLVRPVPRADETPESQTCRQELPESFRDGDLATVLCASGSRIVERAYTRRWGVWHEGLDRQGGRPLSDAELRGSADEDSTVVRFTPRPTNAPQPRSPRRVVVTGLGAVSPLGVGAADMWQGLMQGRSGVRALEGPEFADLPVRIAATVTADPTQWIPPARARRMNRASQFAVLAAREAWQDAGFDPAGTAASGLDPERVGVSIGTIIGGAPVLVDGDRRLRERGARAVPPLTAPMAIPSQAAAQIAICLAITGEARTVVSACASGTEAIGQVIDRIRYGHVDVALAGGTEAVITPAVMASFSAMRALSTRNDEPGYASRPFAKDRDGFVHGEGAGLLVLEAEEHALARGARIYAEAAGWGLSADAHHIASPDPSGKGVALALRRALTDAEAHPVDVVHVNAHATATVEGDLAEATALRGVLEGSGAYPPVPVTSVKGNLGHLQGAAGGVEAIAAVLTLHHRLIPPTLGCDDLDDAIGLDVVRPVPRALPSAGDLVLSNSFGFGGHNAVLALRRYGAGAA
ncbi:beta-ketoacyl-[acyl-carrier-protein] synthase family protein [Streptomyces sp. NBC_01233]|uniref:beta-ketoacyl-[acyl-carrier-protein] synthase family protein n=1 Tax=Streptomyces sp. NBC_01233 TaxID=2903787 RepID=UPI002E14FB5C|nr:beta-ketoacyl-[acyl-carrier-protein] synthase family protein [Streptomyces sp. NBC_01233]